MEDIEHTNTPAIRENQIGLFAKGMKIDVIVGDKSTQGALDAPIVLGKPLCYSLGNGAIERSIVRSVRQVSNDGCQLEVTLDDGSSMNVRVQAASNEAALDDGEVIMPPGLKVEITKVGVDSTDPVEAEVLIATLGQRFIYQPKDTPVVSTNIIVEYRQTSDNFIDITTLSGSLYRVHIDRHTNRDKFDALVSEQNRQRIVSQVGTTKRSIWSLLGFHKKKD
jgi:hypothetical protein